MAKYAIEKYSVEKTDGRLKFYINDEKIRPTDDNDDVFGILASQIIEDHIKYLNDEAFKNNCNAKKIFFHDSCYVEEGIAMDRYRYLKVRVEHEESLYLLPLMILPSYEWINGWAQDRVEDFMINWKHQIIAQIDLWWDLHRRDHGSAFDRVCF